MAEFDKRERHPLVQEWLAGNMDAGGTIAALERRLTAEMEKEPEVYTLRAEVAHRQARIDELERELAHWKDCHGVTADRLAAAEASLSAERRPASEEIIEIDEDGKVHYPASSKRRCPTCNGIGAVQVRPPTDEDSGTEPCPDCEEHASVSHEQRLDQYRRALGQAGYALFQIKRMVGVPQHVIDFVREEHAKACAAMDGDVDAGAPASAKLSAVAEQEPVAWRYRYKPNGAWKYVDKENECNPTPNYEREPLYGHPWASSRGSE
jgi:hypothetical protein